MRSAIFICTLCFAHIAFAQADNSYGEWSVSSDSSGSIAVTKNESGSALGYLCIGEASSCQPFLSIPLDCNVKDSYPVMISSAAGASAATLTCLQVGKNKYYFFNETGLFSSAMESGGDVGFAFPVKDGKFLVSRFSTVGAVPAIKDAIGRQAPKVNKNSHKDEVF